MGIHSIRLPDVGEGVAEAELVEWNVKVGDTVIEDEIIAAVMTDKAAVEIPTSVTGKVVWVGGEIGEIISVGAELLRLEVDGEGNVSADDAVSQPDEVVENSATAATKLATELEPAVAEDDSSASDTTNNSLPPKAAVQTGGQLQARPAGRVLAAPSVRKKARDMGIDLRVVAGSGPQGRVIHQDLDNFDGQTIAIGKAPDTSINEIKVVGLRRLIASKMSQSKKHIPHITIVEEVDVTNLEQTREELNTSYQDDRGKLTLLPFLIKAVVEAVREQPQMNALYDDDAEVIRQHGAVHIGMATQTPGGLMVPVIKHCEIRSLWDSAAEMARLAGACRDGTASREELSGSTITISSLGPMGAIATTPIINYPEVAIVGINKIATRPVWDGQQFIPRKMMNISCAFDHRVVDGWDAAVMVQKLKTLLEKPSMLLVET